MWVDILEVPGRDIVSGSNFFGLGGNSMLMLSLHVSVLKEFGINPGVVDLFENAEFGAMTLLLEGRVSYPDRTGKRE